MELKEVYNLKTLCEESSFLGRSTSICLLVTRIAKMKLLAVFLQVSTALAYAIDRSRIVSRNSEEKINEFTYAGDTGPLHWHYLDPSNNGACASGRHQSPIDIITEEIGFAAPGSIHINIPNSNASTFENIGSGLEVLAQGSCAMNEKVYPLKQFHFHTPSEHRVNGEHFPMEAHFVFQTGSMYPHSSKSMVSLF